MEQTNQNKVSPISDELATRIIEVLDKTNQGEEFQKSDYLVLLAVGIVIPLILMIVGWYL